jgi:hypothetical protein
VPKSGDRGTSLASLLPSLPLEGVIGKSLGNVGGGMPSQRTQALDQEVDMGSVVRVVQAGGLLAVRVGDMPKRQ